MDCDQQMLIERECERLVMRYCHLIDRGEAALVADLFTDDGVWKAPGIVLAGRNEVAAQMAARQERADLRSRHVCSTFVCDVTDEDHASGVVYLSLYRRTADPDRKGPVGVAGPTVVGEYRDEFARTDHGWRIAKRELIVTFVREES